MFEKEAEKYFKSICEDYNEEYERTGKRHYFVGFDIKNGYLAGAEFGYNKGYHDAEEHYMNVIDSQHKLVEESKANEWHYVKDGDLPKVNELVLIKITGCFVLGWTNGINWFNDSNNGTIIDRRMVYAWKEIVLPKEIE